VNAYRIAQSDVSYTESQLLTDSDSDSDSEFSADSSSDSDLSKDDRRSRRKRKGKEKRRRQDSRQRNRKENPRTWGKDLKGEIANPLEEKVMDLAKKLEEIQGQSSPATVAPVSPGNVNPLTMMPQYVPPLGCGATELQGHPSNLIEAGRPDWTVSNPNVVCYNYETPGHYESRCLRPRVAAEIHLEHIQWINANSGRRRSYPACSGQNDSRLQQQVDFLRRQVMEIRAGQIAAGSGQGAAGYGQIVAGQVQFGVG